MPPIVSAPAALIRHVSRLALALAALGMLLVLSPLQDGSSSSAGAPGLLAAFSFDDGEGSSAADAAGNGRTGTVAGATWTTDGRFGGALVFDGADDVVSAGVGGAAALTLEAWVKPVSASGAQPVIVWTAGGHRPTALYATSDGGGPAGRVGDTDVAAGSTIAANAWSHLALTYDGSRLEVYVNGAAVASRPASESGTGAADLLEIGGSSAVGEWFAGAVDEVRVYDRALSATEIAADMSDALAAARPVAPANEEAPAITGTAAVKSTLTASPGRWSGTAPIAYAYAWLRCDSGGSSCGAIAGATEQSYTAVVEDRSTTLRVTVTASNAAGSQSATSAPTAPVQHQSDKKPGAPTDTQPPTAPTGVAVAVSGDQATVTWNPATDNVGVAGYGVYKDGVRVASTTRESATISGLSCGGPSTIGVDAFDAAGNRSAQATTSLPARPCGDVQPPTVPEQLRVTRTEASRIWVDWQPASDNVGVVLYGVYRDGVRLDSVGRTRFTFSGLTCGRRYVLAADAVDAAGNRSAPATVAASTASCPSSVPSATSDVEPPTAPTNLAAPAVTQTTVGLAWAAATDNVGVAGYGVYVEDVRVASTTGTSSSLSGLSCGRSYSVAVDAYDAAGNRSPRTGAVVATAACADTRAPTVPTNVVQTASTETSVSIAWSPAWDDVGVVGYGLYRGETRVATTSSTAYTFAGLTCGTVYAFGVDAYDAAANRSGWASALMATAPCRDTSPPSTPASLAVTGATSSSVTLGWSASTDDVGVAKYLLYRDGVAAGETTATTFSVAGLACAASYAVTVEAVDAAGNRSAPARVTASTSACAPSVAPASVYVSPWGVDSNPCIEVLPCATFERAYRAVQAGGTVEVTGGSYKPQTITRDVSKGTARVTFRPLAGSTVNVDLIDFGQEQLSLEGPDFVTIESLNVAYTRVWPTSDGILLLNVTGKTFDIFGGVGNTVSGGRYGPCEATLFGACTNRMLGAGTVVDGAAIFGVTSLNPADLHTDGIFVRGCTNCTIRNSKFWDNDTTHIRAQNCCSLGPITGLRIENNWFDRPTNLDKSRRWNAIDIDSVIPNLLVRNNSFHPLAGLNLAEGFTGANAVVVGNVSSEPWSGCRAGVLYRNNLWTPWPGQTTGYTCGSGDKLVQVGELAYASAVDGGGLDYHLRVGSPAIAAGDIGNCPGDDIDRQLRFASCDAGSDQR